jgi:hypothetical protein
MTVEKAKKLTAEQQFRLDMEVLVRLREFKRFLWRVIQEAGLFEATTDGSEGRDRYRAGRRDLGLAILDMAELGQPLPDVHPDGPLLTMIQILLEETQRPPEEKPNARSPQYDRTDDLRDEGDLLADPE